MEAEQSKRSLLKTITWRITASLDTFIIAWVIIGDCKMGGSIAGIEVITKMFIYLGPFLISMTQIYQRTE